MDSQVYSSFDIFAMLFAMVAGLCLLLWLVFVVPYRMAKARKRDSLAWVIVSVLGSPFLAIFLLLFLGNSKVKST